MEKNEYIELIVSGFKGAIELTPETFDVKEVIEVIEQTERLLFPGDRTNRPLLTYRIEEGSVRNIFKTSAQVVIGFAALLTQIIKSQQIDFLELNSAKAIETFQQMAIEKDYEFEIKTSLLESPILKINKSTYFFRTEEEWIDAEFYFYGIVTNAGGKDKANIHLYSSEYGTLIIKTPQTFLKKVEKNILYKEYGVRAKGKQNTSTGEIDKGSLEFIELLDYEISYNEQYLKSLREKASKWLKNIDPDKLMNELRGYDV